MKLYADFAPRRTAQIIADILALLGIVLAIWAGAAVHATVVALADLGRQIEDAGTGFRENMTEIGETLGGVPLLGEGIRAPFDAASGAGGTLESAGQTQQDVVSTAAVLLGLAVALAPIGFILLLWALPRLRFARRAAEAVRLRAMPEGAELLALRALDGASAQELLAIAPRPLAAWRAGDVEVTRALAQLELRGAGVRLR